MTCLFNKYIHGHDIVLHSLHKSLFLSIIVHLHEFLIGRTSIQKIKFSSDKVYNT